VLPRPLRRVVRFLNAPALAERQMPRHAGSLLALGFLGATGLYGMVLGGHTGHVVNVGTAAAGFAVEDVVVTGNRETSEIDILQQLGLDGSTSIMALGVEEARTALLDLPWVAAAQVRKVYPNHIEVLLKERQAFAIWQNGSELTLIEKNGNVIASMNEKRFTDLPLYVGLGAETKAAAFDRVISGYPDLKRRVRAYVRVADRRWDLYLTNGVTVRLPQDDVAGAVAALAGMDQSHELLSRDIASVDLRLKDRVTVRLTPDAVERREAAIEQRTKDMKAKGWRI
jgi:cell division protein FtsQ